jgi:Domain of unknown function (DUF3291)
MRPESEYVVLASHLPLRKFSSSVRFFRGVSAMRKQLAGAQGLMGYTLRAQPLARKYWTLSVWRDGDALRQFVRTSPHVELMKSLLPVMGPTKFVEWTVTGADGRPTWSDALTRLQSA